MLTRRDFALTVGSATAGLLAAPVFALPRLRIQDAGLTVTELRDGIWAVVGGGGNSMVIQTGDGGILVDTKVPQVGEALQKHTVELLGEMPAIVINTHHHGDHVGNNFLFAADARIVGHANIQPRMQETIDGWLKRSMMQMANAARTRGDEAEAERLVQQAEALSADQFVADVSFDDTHTVERGTRKLSLTHITPAHTDNDAFVHFGEENIIHMGDLFFHEIHPYMDTGAQSNSTRWRNVLKAAMERSDSETIIVPGHGEITNRHGLQKQIDYFDYLEEAAHKAIVNGMGREQLADVGLGPFAQYAGDRGVTNLQNVFDELINSGVRG